MTSLQSSTRRPRPRTSWLRRTDTTSGMRTRLRGRGGDAATAAGQTSTRGTGRTPTPTTANRRPPPRKRRATRYRPEDAVAVRPEEVRSRSEVGPESQTSTKNFPSSGEAGQGRKGSPSSSRTDGLRHNLRTATTVIGLTSRGRRSGTLDLAAAAGVASHSHPVTAGTTVIAIATKVDLAEAVSLLEAAVEAVVEGEEAAQLETTENSLNPRSTVASSSPPGPWRSQLATLTTEMGICLETGHEGSSSSLAGRWRCWRRI